MSKTQCIWCDSENVKVEATRTDGDFCHECKIYTENCECLNCGDVWEYQEWEYCEYHEHLKWLPF